MPSNLNRDIRDTSCNVKQERPSAWTWIAPPTPYYVTSICISGGQCVQ